MEDNKNLKGELIAEVEYERNKVKRLFNDRQLAIIFYTGFYGYSAVKIGMKLGFSNRTMEGDKNKIAEIIENSYNDFFNCNYKPNKLIKEFWCKYEHPIRYILFKGFGADVYNNYGQFEDYLKHKKILKHMGIFTPL